MERYHTDPQIVEEKDPEIALLQRFLVYVLQGHCKSSSQRGRAAVGFASKFGCVFARALYETTDLFEIDDCVVDGGRCEGVVVLLEMGFCEDVC